MPNNGYQAVLQCEIVRFHRSQEFRSFIYVIYGRPQTPDETVWNLKQFISF